MINFALLLLCLIAGILLRRSGKFPQNTPQALNGFVIYLSLPALILVQIPALLSTRSIDASFLLPVSMAWLLFPLSCLTFVALGRHWGWSREKIGSLALTAGLGNTSFVGLPLLDTLLGPEAVQVGILVDQPGTFLVLSTLGIAAAASFSGSKPNWRMILKRIVTFPPFVAIVIGVLWWASGVTHANSNALVVFERLAGTLVPLALVSVGFQLQFGLALLRRRWTDLLAGLAFKLLIAPIFFFVIYVYMIGSRSFDTHVTVLEAAMAPMITSAIVAAEFRLDAELASLMVGIGISLSFISVPLWHLFLSAYL